MILSSSSGAIITSFIAGFRQADPVALNGAHSERNCRYGCALKCHLPRAKQRTEARRGMIRAPTFTASIRPALTSRLTVLSLTSPRSACVALIEITSGSSAKRLACRSFTGLTSRNDLPFSRVFSTGQDNQTRILVKYVMGLILVSAKYMLFFMQPAEMSTTSQRVIY